VRLVADELLAEIGDTAPSVSGVFRR